MSNNVSATKHLCRVYYSLYGGDREMPSYAHIDVQVSLV